MSEFISNLALETALNCVFHSKPEYSSLTELREKFNTASKKGFEPSGGWQIAEQFEDFEYCSGCVVSLIESMKEQIEKGLKVVTDESKKELESNPVHHLNYVDVIGKGCEGWLNLFVGDYCICLVQDVDSANKIRSEVDKRRV